MTEDSNSARSAKTAVSSAFLTTHWTRVLQAQGNSTDARSALSDLCGAYYAPVFAFVRRSTNDDQSARDLTHEFFARLLAKNSIDNADPRRGRFRSYLLGAVKHFLSDARDRDHRLKRGGGQQMQSLDQQTETSTSIQLPDANAVSPDHEFDRKWALTVLDRALTRLSDEHKAAEHQTHFEVLKPWLTGDTDNLSQADAAKQLSMNEAAVKVAIHRLRRRFREVIKSEIAETLHDPAHVTEELQHLISTLAKA